MKKYYIIRPDGSSIFKLPYPYDFCMHCLIRLLDVSDEAYNLLHFVEPSDIAEFNLFPAVQADRGTGD